MKSVVPQLSLELLVRYCVRIVLFPIMPVFIVCKLAMDLAVVVYDLLQGIIHRSDFLHDPLRKPIDSKTKLDIPRVCSYKSFYLPMRDGTRIAVDVWLPPKAQEGGQVSAIFHQARYYRQVQYRAAGWGFCRGMRGWRGTQLLTRVTYVMWVGRDVC